MRDKESNVFHLCHDTRVSRRRFLITSTASALAFTFPFVNVIEQEAYGEQTMNLPKTALVVWYSQTGNTGRYGRLIASTLEKTGLTVRADDYRNLDPADLADYDMIVAGSPVYYYEVPSNFMRWLERAPALEGKPVAAYVSFGGEGGNQFNTAVTLLNALTDKGGVPLGIDMFGSMSTFAITWSTGNVTRVLDYSHRPDEASYRRVRDFALTLSDQAAKGQAQRFKKKMDVREWFKGGVSIWGTKLMINRHTIDTHRCVGCGLCTRLCPVSAIDLASGMIDSKACIACLGCVNNCPEQAVDMEFMHRKVYGYRDFVKQKNIIIHEPADLG